MRISCTVQWLSPTRVWTRTGALLRKMKPLWVNLVRMTIWALYHFMVTEMYTLMANYNGWQKSLGHWCNATNYLCLTTEVWKKPSCLQNYRIKLTMPWWWTSTLEITKGNNTLLNPRTCTQTNIQTSYKLRSEGVDENPLLDFSSIESLRLAL